MVPATPDVGQREIRGIDVSDLLTVADRFKVPAAKTVLGEVREAVRRWLEFADESGVPEPHRLRIAADLETFAIFES